MFVAVVQVVGMVCAAQPRAGGGPENVAVVVNADSWASLAMANAFIHLRQIPASNVIYLEGFSDFEQIDVAQFRERILKPVFGTLQQRRCGG